MDNQISLIFLLLVIFQFKHFIADYPLQGKYMLGKFKYKGWVAPLAAHCAVHFMFTFFISLGVFVFSDLQTPKYFWASVLFGLIDFTIHFIMDRIKASPNLLGRFKALSAKEMMRILNRENIDGDPDGLRPTDSGVKHALRSNVLFWWSLGIDQMVHHLTDILIIYLVVTL